MRIGHRMHQSEMAQHQRCAVLVSVPVQMSAQTQHVSLVHSNVDAVGEKALPQGVKHGVQQRLGVRRVREEDVACVHDLLHGFPLQRLAQMSQRLDGRHQLYTERSGKGIQIFELCFGIASPSMAEIGVSLHFIHVLHVQLNGIVPHAAEHPQQPPERFRARHRVAGAVHHDPQPPVGRLLAAAPSHRPAEVCLQQRRRPPQHSRVLQPQAPAAVRPAELYSGSARFHRYRQFRFFGLQRLQQFFLKFCQILPHTVPPFVP